MSNINQKSDDPIVKSQDDVLAELYDEFLKECLTNGIDPRTTIYYSFDIDSQKLTTK